MSREFIRSFVTTHHRMSHALPLAGPLFFGVPLTTRSPLSAPYAAAVP